MNAILPRTPKRPYIEAAQELVSLLNGMESDYVRRIARIFIEQSGKLMDLVLYPHFTERAHESFPDGPRFEVTELMERLLITAKERDFDKLAIIEHEIFLPNVVEPWPCKNGA